MIRYSYGGHWGEGCYHDSEAPPSQNSVHAYVYEDAEIEAMCFSRLCRAAITPLRLCHCTINHALPHFNCPSAFNCQQCKCMHENVVYVKDWNVILKTKTFFKDSDNSKRICSLPFRSCECPTSSLWSLSPLQTFLYCKQDPATTMKTISYMCKEIWGCAQVLRPHPKLQFN